MKKILIIVLGMLTAATTMAQELTPFEAFKVKEKVSIEILDITRVEQYGWDNLEINYRVVNESNYDLKKVDFFVHFADEKGEEIGTTELFSFNVQKNSQEVSKGIEVLSPYVNEKIATHFVEILEIDILQDEQGATVSIDASQPVIK